MNKKNTFFIFHYVPVSVSRETCVCSWWAVFRHLSFSPFWTLDFVAHPVGLQVHPSLVDPSIIQAYFSIIVLFMIV